MTPSHLLAIGIVATLAVGGAAYYMHTQAVHAEVAKTQAAAKAKKAADKAAFDAALKARFGSPEWKRTVDAAYKSGAYQGVSRADFEKAARAVASMQF